ncbi:SCO0930 family lipoprotein [Streptomyces sp. NPDC096132]|uniref:SCO0930 family lipoprotein n=1 Tax=Streptomyces sp. NPDC096132 TaxID=3366075 RepID=UPI0038098BD0
MRKFTCVPLALTVSAVMMTAACGSSQSGDAAPAAAASPVTTTVNGTPAADGDAGAQPSEAGRLSVWESAGLGPVVTDGAGFTLYRFDKDTASPPVSNCAGDCATTWPPVPADGVAAPQGIDASLLGSVTRADGGRQLTLAGWPLYRYAQDTGPRQTNGQGVGGTWFAAAPDGKKAGKSATGRTPEAQEELPALSTVDDPALGEIVRDGKGRTLYRFTKDTAWPMKSNCLGDCLGTWKPAKPVDVTNVKGIDPELLSTYTRPDGTKQLALDCWPLYWFTGDQNPGDTNGQGVGGTWFAVRADGKLVK